MSSCEETLRRIGGKLSKTAGNIATFYHISPSSSDIEALSAMSTLDGFAFYLSDISDDDVERLSYNSNLKKIAFFSCKNITDGVFTALSRYDQIEEVVFLDVNVSRSALDRFISDNPSVVVRFTDRKSN